MSTEQRLKCFRGACTNDASPLGWNRVTGGHYCLDCAREIERYREPAGCASFFPLLNDDNQQKLRGLNTGSWAGVVILVRV